MLKVMGVPIGLGGACGIMRVTVLKDMDGGAGVPLLLGVGLLEALAATIDVGKGTLAMPAIGRNTDLVKLPSGHLAASIVNYPDEGWEMPEECLPETGINPFKLPQGARGLEIGVAFCVKLDSEGQPAEVAQADDMDPMTLYRRSIAISRNTDGSWKSNIYTTPEDHGVSSHRPGVKILFQRDIGRTVEKEVDEDLGHEGQSLPCRSCAGGPE